MDYSTDRGGDLHYVHQELKASVPGVGEDVPESVLAAVARLSGGYKHLAQSSYVETSSDGGGYFVYWTDGKVFGEVTATSGSWTATRRPKNLSLTGRVVPVDQLTQVELAETPQIDQDPFRHSVSLTARVRISFADGTDIVVPQTAPTDAGQRAGLDNFISAALAAARRETSE